jgi:hypothetical protein
LCDDVLQAVAAVQRIAAPGDLVLVKASRAARLERVADALRSPEGVAGSTADPLESRTHLEGKTA